MTTERDHVEGVTDRTFYAEAQDLERDLRERFRDRSLRYRLLVLRRLIVRGFHADVVPS